MAERIVRDRPVDRYLRWVLVVAWVSLPVLVGSLVGDALATTAPAGARWCTIGAWAIWTAALVALLVPTTTSLTVCRLIIPAAAPLGLWAAARVASDGTSELALHHGLGVTVPALAVVLVLTPQVGGVFVNGSAYGDERRFLLRAPAVLLLGPLELAWVLGVIGAVGGPVLLAYGSIPAGLALLVVGWPVCWVVARGMHGLHRRWFVLVPAGVVLHDHAALTESIMAPRRTVARLGPAPADRAAEATDLTMGAAGLVLELILAEPTPVSRRPARRPGTGAVAEAEQTGAVLFVPTRPGALLSVADERRLPVG